MAYMNKNAVVSAVGGQPQVVQRAVGEVDLSSLTDKELDDLYKDWEGLEETNVEQMAEAAALRDQGGAQARQIGKMYLAANPLEHLAKGVGRGMGDFMARDVRNTRASQGDARQAALSALAKSRMGGGSPISGAMNGWGSGLNALNMQVK